MAARFMRCAATLLHVMYTNHRDVVSRVISNHLLYSGLLARDRDVRLAHDFRDTFRDRNKLTMPIPFLPLRLSTGSDLSDAQTCECDCGRVSRVFAVLRCRFPTVSIYALLYTLFILAYTACSD